MRNMGVEKYIWTPPVSYFEWQHCCLKRLWDVQSGIESLFLFDLHSYVINFFSDFLILQGLSLPKTEAWMRNLPDGKVPLANSPGETYWTQQRERQMPKQDLDAKNCEHLKGKGEADSFKVSVRLTGSG